jgi:Flp pilus assembly protein TadG
MFPTANPRSCTRRTTTRMLRRKTEYGAALVEYAFILILFLSLLFGISGFGHALYVYHAVNNAAKEGTRWAAVNGYNCPDDNSCNGINGMNNGRASATDIQNYVMARLPESLDSTKATVTATFLAPSGSPPVCTAPVPSLANPLVNVGAFPNYPGCTVQVQVQYTYDFVFPLIRTTPLNMSSTSQMVIAH